MKILIRANGDLKLGLGHIFRCIAISEKFQKLFNESNIYFVTEADLEIKNNLLKNYKCLDPSNDEIKVNSLIKSSQIFISDLLDTPNSYISKIKKLNPEILVICIDNNTKFKELSSPDIVFNANVFDVPEIIDKDRRYYLGPDYMILRENFDLTERKNDIRECKNVFISFGGADEKGCTINVLKSLINFKKDLNFHVIVGPLFTYFEELKILADFDRRIRIFKQPEDIYTIMQRSDLAIIAAGITLYELSYLGVPSLVIPQVDHQEKIAEAFAKRAACIDLGKNPTTDDILTNLEKLLLNKSMRSTLHDNSMKFVDGKGLKRFIKIILYDLNERKIQELETS